MSPFLMPNDFVLMRKVRNVSALAVGTVVLVQHPEFGPIIKRILKIQSAGVWLKGDSIHSSSPQQMGLLPFKAITHQLVWRISGKR